MRVLHTSDWHLGRTLHGVDLHEHQAAHLDHLVELVRDRGVDLVVVAGDVFDRAVPPVPSVRLLGDALRRLAEHAVVVLTPGNHDSAVRLGFAAELLRDGVHVLASVERLATPVVLHDADGPVAVYGIPYLDPDTTRHVLAGPVDEERPAPGSDRGTAGGAPTGPAAGPEVPGPSGPAMPVASGPTGSGADAPAASGPVPPLARSHEAVVAAAMRRVRADLATRPGTRSIVVAHAFVAGGEASESERDIRVGGVDSVPVGVFAGVDHVALGHLHGAQRVGPEGARPSVRYSGSPLAFSFGERHQVKSSALVTLAADGSTTVELVPAPVPRHVAEVTGTLEQLLDGRHDALADAWLRVVVTDPVHPEALWARVHERFPHALVVQHVPEGAVDAPALRAVTAETDPLEVAADFVAYATGGPADADELDVLREAYEAALAEEADA